MFTSDVQAIKRLVKNLSNGRIHASLAEHGFQLEGRRDLVCYLTARAGAETKFSSVILPMRVPETVLLPDHAMLVFMGALEPPLRPAKLCHWEAIVVDYLQKHFAEYLV